MTDEEREKRNARRRQDPNRPLEFVILQLSTLRDMLEASPRQCHDFMCLLLYLAERPQMGNFIPGAATWGKEKCARTLRIRGKISADCALFRRESGGIRCTAYPVEEVAGVLEKRAINRENALARWSTDGHATACATEHAEKEIEGEIETETGAGASLQTSPQAQDAGQALTDGRMDGGQAPQAGGVAKAYNRPHDVQEVEEAARMMLPPGMADDAPRIAAEFYETNQASGWTDEEGHPVRNWYNRLRRYCERCATNGSTPQATPQDFPRPSVDEVVKKLRRFRSCKFLDEAGLIAKAREFLAWAERRKWQNTAGRQISPRAWNGVFFTSFMGGELINLY